MKKLIVPMVLSIVLTGCGKVNVSKEEYQLVEGSEFLDENEKALVGNIKVIPDFKMNTLNRERNIWVYLPPSYDESNDNYPVLYMQDGQSLFKSKETE